ncbi:hypothetical protein [Virgibacillus pantothenticus]|uniref:hypothetical protein n=1 Tax=Virgibacillus pantothenticus TaxID=1473 RepID=UPI001BAFC1B9|nr:hypothetical protein [Virgibacillus pantothenticus]
MKTTAHLKQCELSFIFSSFMAIFLLVIQIAVYLQRIAWSSAVFEALRAPT